MPHKSESNPPRKPPTWLNDQVYSPKRERTLDLVTRSVEALREAGQRISLASVSRKSKELDPEGLGVSESAVLTNGAAYAYYKQHCTWKGNRDKRTPAGYKPNMRQPRRVNPDRDLLRTRQRYLRMAKAELVDRLLALEHAYAEREERWLQANEELLALRMQADHK